VRLPITGDTTAGWCFLNGTLLEVPNLLQDARFKERSFVGQGPHATTPHAMTPDATTPEASHAKTFSIVCVPIKASIGHVDMATSEESFATLGVVEVITSEPLHASATQLLQDYVELIARVLERAQGRRHARAVKEATAKMADSTTRREALDGMDHQVKTCLNAANAGVMLLDRSSQILIRSCTNAHGDSVVCEKTTDQAGLAGYVVRSRQVINALDIARVCTSDGTLYVSASDFITDEDLAKVQQGFDVAAPVAVLMAPVFRPGGEVLGVVFALQKTATRRSDVCQELQYFDELDERGLVELAAELGRILVRIEQSEEDQLVISGYETLLDCSPELLSEFDLRRLIRIISRNVCQVTNAQCTTAL